jgi:hypothetical protein
VRLEALANHSSLKERIREPSGLERRSIWRDVVSHCEILEDQGGKESIPIVPAKVESICSAGI